MSAEFLCNVCKKVSNSKCGNCRGVSYCCKSHQKLDWKNHKPNCFSYKVAKNERLGRHLVATRCYSEGEIVIKEPPLVEGPSMVTLPVCLGCYKPLTQFNFRNCSRCGWPVCSEFCEKSELHLPECEICSKGKIQKVEIRNEHHPLYHFVIVLRCVYLKESQPKQWEKLMELESRCQAKESETQYNDTQLFVMKHFSKYFPHVNVTNEDILKITGIIQINAHVIPLNDPNYIAIYEKASLLEHNCRANCMKSFTDSGDLVIRAAETISPGDHLSICYTDPLWGREMRLNHLLSTKFFECQCERCLDPTEFGTHFNSLRVPNSDCCFLPYTKEDFSVKCPTCGRTLTKQDLPTISLENVLDELSKVDKTCVKSCKDFLNKYEKVFHPNHHVLLAIKLALADLFGWPDLLLSVEDGDLEWAVKTCRELYGLTTKLIPAENRLRGLILLYLQYGLRERERRKALRVDTEPGQARKNLLERRDVLTNAYKLLSYEPSRLPEGEMAKDAKKALESVEKILKTQSNV